MTGRIVTTSVVLGVLLLLLLPSLLMTVSLGSALFSSGMEPGLPILFISSLAWSAFVGLLTLRRVNALRSLSRRSPTEPL